MVSKHSHIIMVTQQHKSSKLNKLRSFLKSIRTKVNRKRSKQTPATEKRRVQQFLPTVTQSPRQQSQFLYPYSYTYTSFRSRNTSTLDTCPYAVSHVLASSYPAPALKQHVMKPTQSSMFSESEYEEMTSDFCTLPRKKMKYRIKQRVFEKSLNAILLEAKKEIIEESSEDEKDNTYVHESIDNIYEELNLSASFVVISHLTKFI